MSKSQWALRPAALTLKVVIAGTACVRAKAECDGKSL
jgi:hypothetical protein